MQTAERRRGRFRWGARVTALALVAAVPVLAATDAVAQVPDRAGAMAASGAVWDRVPTPIPRMHQGNTAVIDAQKFRAFDLQEPAIKAALAAAPHESAAGALSLALPAPGGGFERFAVQRSQVMAPRLAAKHPEIRTYSRRGNHRRDRHRADQRHAGSASRRRSAARRARGTSTPTTTTTAALYVSYFRRNLEERPRAAEGAGPRRRRPGRRLARAAARTRGGARAEAQRQGARPVAAGSAQRDRRPAARIPPRARVTTRPTPTDFRRGQRHRRQGRADQPGRPRSTRTRPRSGSC